MKFTCQKDLLGFKKGLLYEMAYYDNKIEVYLKESSTIHYINLVVPCPREMFLKVWNETEDTLMELGIISRQGSMCPECNTWYINSHVCYYPCQLCGILISSCELCEECSKRNDPFNLNPNKHEYLPRTEL